MKSICGTLSVFLLIFCLGLPSTMLAQRKVVTKGRVWDVAFADLNKDGFSDMVVADWFKPPTIFYNDQKENYEDPKSLISHPAKDSCFRVHGIAINDLNNDRNPDIFAVFNGLNNLIYLHNDGEFIVKDTTSNNNSDGLNISLGDIDNDDDIDAITTNYKQPAVLWINNSEGQFSKSEFEFGNYNMLNTAIGDINNDGHLDIISSVYREVILWFNNGNGTFNKNTQSITNNQGYGLAELADMDDDSDLDIVFSNSELGTSIWLNDGKGNFTDAAIKLSKCIHLALGDMDSNGQIDVVCGNTIWLNQGNLLFEVYDSFEHAGRILGLWLNDMDNNNDLDLFYSTSNQEDGLVLLKNPIQ